MNFKSLKYRFGLSLLSLVFIPTGSAQDAMTRRYPMFEKDLPRLGEELAVENLDVEGVQADDPSKQLWGDGINVQVTLQDEKCSGQTMISETSDAVRFHHLFRSGPSWSVACTAPAVVHHLLRLKGSEGITERREVLYGFAPVDSQRHAVFGTPTSRFKLSADVATQQGQSRYSNITVERLDPAQ